MRVPFTKMFQASFSQGLRVTLQPFPVAVTMIIALIFVFWDALGVAMALSMTPLTECAASWCIGLIGWPGAAIWVIGLLCGVNFLTTVAALLVLRSAVGHAVGDDI